MARWLNRELFQLASEEDVFTEHIPRARRGSIRLSFHPLLAHTP
jgi:hypothetical protein